MVQRLKEVHTYYQNAGEVNAAAKVWALIQELEKDGLPEELEMKNRIGDISMLRENGYLSLDKILAELGDPQDHKRKETVRRRFLRLAYYGIQQDGNESVMHLEFDPIQIQVRYNRIRTISELRQLLKDVEAGSHSVQLRNIGTLKLKRLNTALAEFDQRLAELAPASTETDSDTE